MKLLCCTIIVTFIGLMPQGVFAASDLPWEKKLPFKKATIEYRVSGVDSGKETLYIRAHGKERAKYRDTETKMMGMLVKDTSIEFVTPDHIYSYNLQTGDAVKGANPQKYMIEEFDKLSAADKKKVRDNAKKMGATYTQGVGGRVVEKAKKILGYDCDLVEITGGGATYILHGTDIPLKLEVNMMGMKMITEAISISKGKADDRYFEHPEGVVPQEDANSDQMARMMGQQVITMLKDPENAKIQPGAAMRMPPMEKDMNEEDKAMMERAEDMMKNLKNIFSQ